MFPARAGMSPHCYICGSLMDSVPRASGDEPDGSRNAANVAPCSPRERG